MPLFFPKNLAALAGIAPRDVGRCPPALHVLDPGDGCYRVEVTDGKRLAIVCGPCAEEKDSALDPAFRGAAQILIPAADWRTGFRLGGKRRPVGLAADGTTFKLAVGDQAVTGSAPEGRFPNVDWALPKGRALLGFRIDPLLLIGLLQAAAALDPAGGVGVLFYGDGKPVGLVARNDAGQFFDGLLVPLT